LRDEAGQISGYFFAQKGRLGPWVATHPLDAERLLVKALALPYEGPISVAAPTTNPFAQALLNRHGFQPLRANCHMGRGPVGLPGQRQTIYAQTSLAVG